MRRLLALALLLAGPALADISYSATTTTLGLSAASRSVWVGGSPSTSATAYSVAITGPVTLNGSQSINYVGDWDTTTSLSSGNLTIKIGYRRSGVDTQLCSVSQAIGSNTAQVTTTFSQSCTPASTNLLAGDQLWMYAGVTCSGADTCEIYIDPSTKVTWSQTLFFCATTGVSACACGGTCNNATCGTASSIAQSTTCSCDCTATACANISVPAPASFNCVDQLNASVDRCSWGSIAGSTNYLLSRGGSNVYTGGALTFDDATGPGSFAYAVYASGSCPPNSGTGTTLSPKNSATATTTGSVQSRGSVIITGLNDHNPYCKGQSP